MTLFDVNWPTVLNDLTRWHRLPVDARRTVLDTLKPSGSVPVSMVGAYIDPILQSGIGRLDTAQRRVLVAEGARDLVRALRAMDRHRVFDELAPGSMVRYLEEHFTNDDVLRLSGPESRHGYANRRLLASRIEFEGWTGDLLDATTPAKLARWATDRGATLTSPPAASLELLGGLQRFVRSLLDAPQPIPLRDLVARAPGGDISMFADVLYTGLEFVVVVAGLRTSDLEPMVGVWMPAAMELRRPTSAPPGPVVPAESFDLAVRMEDMTALLGEALAQPVRLRASDRAVFAQARKAIDPRLVPLPQWTAAFLPVDATHRVARASTELQRHRLARVRDGRGAAGPPRLEATPAGARWLALPPEGRLSALLGPIRKSKHRNPPTSYSQGTATPFFPYHIPYLIPPDALDLRGDIERAFLSVPDTFVPIADFLEHHSRATNPLLSLQQETETRQRHWLLHLSMGGSDPRQYLRGVWREMLQQFLIDRLVAFGGARLGVTAGGVPCFALTDAGRYLLGASDSFSYGVHEAVDVIVQPNFEVVFLAPAPAAEAAVARFSQRIGRTPGVAFRITRASVLAAAEGGLVLGDVLSVLRDVSSKPIPANVERELSGWLTGVRRATLRPANLLECPDEETATRVLTVLGAKARLLTPTLFELLEMEAAARTALTRRLRAAGVFLSQPSSRTVSAGAKKRPGQRYRLVDPDFDDDGDDDDEGDDGD